MQRTIQKIVDKIPHAVIFDAHLAIEQLEKTLVYDQSRKGDPNYHSQISKMIDKCIGVTRLKDEKSYSANINNSQNTNACWKKN